MERPICTYLLILSSFTFVYVNGRLPDSSPSCKVSVSVRRGTMWKTAPGQRLTVTCPVKHCGQPLNVTWCKLLHTDKCEQLNHIENVEVRQNNADHKYKLMSYLTFKWISIHDDGLYRCVLKGHKYKQISHMINISVSAAVSHDAHVEEASWQPYTFICVSIVFLAATLTVLMLLRFYGWKRVLIVNETRAQEFSCHKMTNLPKWTAPSIPVQPANLYSLNENHSQTGLRRTSQPPLTTSRNQPAVANPSDQSPGSQHEVYAVISRQAVIPAREQHDQTTGNKSTDYAAIKVSKFIR
ncbi:uncharacterized protein si:ch211-214p13.8 isoform X2 [Labrus mixtus]|uniref:uncharacterized protein si:ch211-214p13.8 isoform X2 n=1 Tax=Labrus mixtus TaxID=508554 RepID=UPI0029C0D7C2|nr:uncharacterized protein si:ch211-214p13.8 isoform X2 [Labrus mixtus]